MREPARLRGDPHAGTAQDHLHKLVYVEPRAQRGCSEWAHSGRAAAGDDALTTPITRLARAAASHYTTGNGQGKALSSVRVPGWEAAPLIALRRSSTPVFSWLSNKQRPPQNYLLKFAYFK